VVSLICGLLIGGGLLLNQYIQRHARSTDPTPLAGVEPTSVADPGRAATIITDPFPRRLLFIHVANYIYFNNLSAGMSNGKDMPTRSAEKLAFDLRIPTNPDNNQLFVLSDTAHRKDFVPPVKSVLMQTYERFFQTSRPQDRIIVYFSGHAIAIDGQAYLVPVEGEPGEPETLIPLEDFYSKLSECAAQQKVVLFDVCRLDPRRGEEKPGSEPMSDELAKLLLAAPPGVQVALSCAPGQTAGEDSMTGSEFLTAYRVMSERTKRAGKVLPQTPDDPLPIGAMLDGMRAYLATPRGDAASQTVTVGGTEPTTQVAYNKDEPPAVRFDWPTAPTGVSSEVVVNILRQVSLPGIRADLTVPADLHRVHPFDAEIMKDYADDGVTEEHILRNGEQYPVRKAALDAIQRMSEVWRAAGDGEQTGLKEEFAEEVDDALKQRILEQQQVPARIILVLEDVIHDLAEAEKELPNEKSKRWQAVFRYAQAQALLRWAFMHEYDAALGKIRTDSLPRDPNNPGAGLRLVSTSRISKRDIREKVEEAQEILDQIVAKHSGTPYEVVAKLHRHISVGLEWRVIAKEEPTDEDAK
jgi:hypothetical protein